MYIICINLQNIVEDAMLKDGAISCDFRYKLIDRSVIFLKI